MRILIVEDEPRVAGFMRKGLVEEGYAVDVAANGHDGEFQACTNDYDAILIDWLIPGMDGLELCRVLRKQKVTSPIIMVSSRASTEDKVAALDAGADDYVPKPFSFEELTARIRAHIRRKLGNDAGLRCGALVLDPSRREVFCEDTKIELTHREYSLLQYLLQNHDRVVSKAAISEHVWGTLFDTATNLIEVYINRLRKKLKEHTDHSVIRTVRGFGYTIEENGCAE